MSIDFETITRSSHSLYGIHLANILYSSSPPSSLGFDWNRATQFLARNFALSKSVCHLKVNWNCEKGQIDGEKNPCNAELFICHNLFTLAIPRCEQKHGASAHSPIPFCASINWIIKGFATFIKMKYWRTFVCFFIRRFSSCTRNYWQGACTCDSLYVDSLSLVT